ALSGTRAEVLRFASPARAGANVVRRLSMEAEHLVGRIDLVQMVAQQDSAGEKRTRDAVARVAEREQVVRKVAVRTDVRKAVGRARIRGVPAVRGQDARNVRIERG